MWKEFLASLARHDKVLLSIWMEGAASSPTRRRGLGLSLACSHCGQDKAAIRHFWRSCPRFREKRIELEAAYGIITNFWDDAPAVTASSGWITKSAARTVLQRSRLQVAACILGIEVLRVNRVAEN